MQGNSIKVGKIPFDLYEMGQTARDCKRDCHAETQRLSRTDRRIRIHRMSSPFDDIRALLRQLPVLDEAAASRVRATFAAGDRRRGLSGRIEDMAVWLARWSGHVPTVQRPLVALFAGTHGVAAQGISAYPRRRPRGWWNFARPAVLRSTAPA